MTPGRLVNVHVKMPAATNAPPIAAPRRVMPGSDVASAATATAIAAATRVFSASPALCVLP
jgi:hypothetical protein